MKLAAVGAFGCSVRDLARAGRQPIVLQDCLRWLSRYALHTPKPFTTFVDKRKVLALKHLFDIGKRPLRTGKVANKDPVLVANLLLLWLGSLPEPLFPQAYVPDLLRTQQSDCYVERVAAVRSFLKKTEPFILEALFPLFEFLHHNLINQADRDAALQELGRLFAPYVFGTPQEHGLALEDASLLAETVELMIAEYRPLFTQPYGLNRYEQDAARAQAAAAAKVAKQQLMWQLGEEVIAGSSLSALAFGPPAGLAPVSVGSPALPASGGVLEGVADSEGGVACGLQQGQGYSYYSQFSHSFVGSGGSSTSELWTPFGCLTDATVAGSGSDCSPRSVAGVDDEGLAAMESILSSLLESTVAQLFEDPAVLAGSAGVTALVSGPLGRAASPAKAVPVPAKPRSGQEATASDGTEVGLPLESYASDDWGSFSPTGVILSDDPAAVAQLAGSSSWGCKASSARPAVLVNAGAQVMA